MNIKRIKPVWISIFTVVVFAAALLIGMQTDWWQTEGRRTPLDGETRRGHAQESQEEHAEEGESVVIQEFEEEHEGEEHKTGEITGSSTVQDALDMGISVEDIERVLQGSVDSKDSIIKDLASERGLKFGQVKDELNRLLD